MFSKQREPAVPSAEPNAPKGMGNRSEETERDNVALSQDGAGTVRERQDCQQRGGQGAGGDNMAKILNC